MLCDIEESVDTPRLESCECGDYVRDTLIPHTPTDFYECGKGFWLFKQPNSLLITKLSKRWDCENGGEGGRSGDFKDAPTVGKIGNNDLKRYPPGWIDSPDLREGAAGYHLPESASAVLLSLKLKSKTRNNPDIDCYVESQTSVGVHNGDGFDTAEAGHVTAYAKTNHPVTVIDSKFITLPVKLTNGKFQIFQDISVFGHVTISRNVYILGFWASDVMVKSNKWVTE